VVLVEKMNFYEKGFETITTQRPTPFALRSLRMCCILHDGIVTVRMCYSGFFSVNNVSVNSVNNAVVLLGIPNCGKRLCKGGEIKMNPK